MKQENLQQKARQDKLQEAPRSEWAFLRRRADCEWTREQLWRRGVVVGQVRCATPLTASMLSFRATTVGGGQPAVVEKTADTEDAGLGRDYQTGLS